MTRQAEAALHNHSHCENAGSYIARAVALQCGIIRNLEETVNRDEDGGTAEFEMPKDVEASLACPFCPRHAVTVRWHSKQTKRPDEPETVFYECDEPTCPKRRWHTNG